MKTIAVLTDLSANANHTTRFALRIAKKMKAKVLLFSLCPVAVIKNLVPAGETEPSFIVGNPIEDFASCMEQDLKNRAFQGSYLPEISFNNTDTELVDIMTTIMGNKNISMIVMAPPVNVDMADFILSDAFTRIIDWATVPVMLVPEYAVIKNFEKIAFASMLHAYDIDSVGELGNLMESFAAELMVAHLNENPSDPIVQDAEKQLNQDLYRKLNCGGVYFRSIPDTGHQKNWDWLKANKKTDLLAVVQGPKEQMVKFFNRGTNLYATYHINIPVIILPKLP
ncbi:nucleotide-binding universal stress UspA family protein [Mucilaginibacter frigoritolerans]|jgi:hypothetical protein|uniref:Nucleotide-binding universal stress UspA family protein n=1 Tax=Mucilaginibacter frigoritolerans TaxID=652788 RepID=A0A562U4E5_9SPHI|nr:hypothetical protein [Mucilaginibacter frigoritolerans]TWJ00660.1 nucleotide-binding universal stress UspA family protein [Mucilaginibacter frigoritolerans]